MTTLLLRAAQSLTPLDFSRVGRFFSFVLDVFAEAQAQAREAHKRYPFTE